VDLDNIKLIVGANKEVAALFKDMEIDASYPERFLVVRGDPAIMQELIKKLKPEKALDFHLRPCYRTKDDFEVFLTDDVLVRMKPVLDSIDSPANEEKYIKQYIKPLLNALFKELQWDTNNYRILRVEKDREKEGPLVLFRVLETDPEAPLVAANLLGDEKFKKQMVYASPNFLFQARAGRQPHSPLGVYDPRDAFFYGEEWYLCKLSAWEAWNAVVEHFRNTLPPRRVLPEIRVVVIDSGVDKNHPDLKNNLIWPDPADNSIWNFEIPSNNPSCDYEYHGTSNLEKFPAAHGTACAGVIAARGHLVGIAPACKIVPLRWTQGDTDGLVNAFYRAKELGGHIISFSIYFELKQVPIEDILRDEIAQNTPKGPAMPVFCCAGNSGISIKYPARSEFAIGVGASTSLDERADLSCSGNTLDFLAPGGNWAANDICSDTVVTTDICGGYGFNNDPAVQGSVPLNNYVWTCGTSFAAPLAAGVAALMLIVNKNLSPKKIWEILCRTADKIEPGPAPKANYQDFNAQGQPYPYGSFSQTHGYGRINAAAAIKEVIRRLRRFPPRA
jgi:hypothetical protein